MLLAGPAGNDGSESAASTAPRNPFKHDKQVRRDPKGRPGKGKGGAPGGLNLLGSIGEWEDAASVSSFGTGASERDHLALPAL